MRISLVCPYDWEAPGGVQIHVRELARRLSENHEVVVLAPARGSVADPDVRVVGRPVRIPYRGTVAPVAPSPLDRRRIREALVRFAPDVVHVHEPLTPSTSMYATLVAPAPVVATFHAYLDRSRLLTAARPVLHRVWRRIRIPIAVSEAAASFSVRRFGGEARIIPNGVEVERFRRGTPPPDTPAGRVLLWVNRLDPQKGFGVAVEAFARLAADHDDLQLVVAGDGRERGAVDRLDPGVRRRVHLLGTVPHDELPDRFASADVFVSPAVGQESFGMVLVEAMAAGVPVVATDIPGYRDVLEHGRAGRLVPPGDPTALAGAVGAVLEDPAAAAALAEAGRRRAAAFSWDAVVPRIEAVYEEALRTG